MLRSTFVPALVALAAARASAQCFDWSSGFVSNGTSDHVWTQAVYDDGSGPKLYVGGSFRTAGDVVASLIARWDGASWSAVGGGISGPDGSRVLTLRVFDLGDGPKLYAGGEFELAGGQAANNIAVWDGTSWSPLGEGLISAQTTINGEIVHAMTLFDDGTGPALYAAGAFDTSGATTVRNIARWDGAQWNPMSNGGIPYGIVRALAVYDSGSGPTLYAGGGYREFVGPYEIHLAQWDGANWSPLEPISGIVTDLALHDDGTGEQLYVVAKNGGAVGTKLARWNGAQIETFPGTRFVDRFALHDDGVSGEQLYACGFSGILGPPPWVEVIRWDGSVWSMVGAATLPNRSVLSLASYDDGSGPSLYAGGAFDSVGGQTANHMARFDRANWLPLGTSHAPHERVLALSSFDFGAGDELVVGGEFDRAGSVSVPGIARWNGADWSDIGSAPGDGASAYAFTAWDDGSGAELFAAGTITTLGGQQLNQSLASWNGTAWSQVGTGIPYSAARTFAVFDDGSGDALFVGGHFRIADGAPGDRIAKWDGATWSNLNSGITVTNHDVRALAVYDDGVGEQLYVGGDFKISGALPGRLRRWNGTSWSGLAGGGPDEESVDALCVFDDGRGPALYVGGEFFHCGSVPTNFIARWDGVSWEPLASGMDAPVRALAVFDDGRGPALYAGGAFQFAGNAWARGIARWDGASWEALGSGVNDVVFALHVHDDGSGPALFAGGEFTTAGGRVSNFVARWGRVCCAVESYCTAGTTSSGCVPSISGIGLPSASASSGFTIRVDQVEGQKQGHIFYGVNGALANPWSPLSSSYLCVKAPTQRTPTQNSGGTNGACDGAVQIDWLDYVALHPGSLGVPFSAGTQVWAQLYFRDPPAPKTTNLSDGLTFIVCP